MNATDPYLPTEQATDNVAEQPTKKSPTAWGWIGVIVFLAAVWSFLGERRPAATTQEEHSWLSVVLPWVPVLFVAFVAVWFYRQLRGSSKFLHRLDEATLAQADGELDRARSLLEKVVADYGATGNGPVARLRLAAALEHQGAWDGCRDLLLAVERSPGVWTSDTRTAASTALARVFTLAGEHERASAWMNDAQSRRAKLSTPTLQLVSAQRLAEALLLARQGSFASALAILEQDWSRFEAAMLASQMKVAVLLRAYLTGVIGGPRGEGNASPWVAQLRTSHPVDTAFVYTSRPELATWVQAQGLGVRDVRAVNGG